MRDYSKPPYCLKEPAAVFVGICKAINEPEVPEANNISALPMLGSLICQLARKLGNNAIQPTGDLGWTSIYLQQLIDHIISSQIKSKAELQEYIDAELIKLPPSPFVDYFTGESKI